MNLSKSADEMCCESVRSEIDGTPPAFRPSALHPRHRHVVSKGCSLPYRSSRTTRTESGEKGTSAGATNGQASVFPRLSAEFRGE
jgi:hypothetical protein